MKDKYDLGFLISTLEKIYPWIDKIETDTKKVWLASDADYLEKGSQTVDVIKLYFNYDNPKYIELRGKSISGKQVKQTFYDFLRKYIGVDVNRYGSPVDLEFYEVGPKKF